MSIYLTSDLHLNHNKEFVYFPRGFKSVYEMNDTIISNWNKTVSGDDDVYLLGDIMLGNSQEGIKLFHQLKGNIHIVLGNHDTDERVKLFNKSYNVVEIENAIRLKYNKLHFFMTHYPCITGNLEKESISQCTLNLYGHTHQSGSNFYLDMPFMYHVGVDSHHCTPVLIDDIIKEIEEQAEDCRRYL